MLPKRLNSKSLLTNTVKINLKKAIQILFIALFNLALLSHTPKHEEQIIWNNPQLLTWNDFKGKPIKNSIHGAITSSGFKFEYSYQKGNLIVKSFAFFLPKKSWVKPIAKNEAGLKHEQGHFDISEIYVRKFRKTLSEEKLTPKKFQMQISKIYASTKAELKTFQNLYDKETEHHLNKVKQLEWNAKIAQQLNDLEEYNKEDLALSVK